MTLVDRRIVAIVVAVLVVGVVVGLLGLVPVGGSPGAQATPVAQSTPTAPAVDAPAGTKVVALLPTGSYSTFAWSPDGSHILVTGGDNYETRVYDRAGKLVSTYGSIESWLDATHLIDGSGYVSTLGVDHTGGPTANTRAVANGHGSAALIVAVPACVGDPIIDWYRDGQHVKAGEKATPYGWSPDGKLVLLGHMSCDSQDAEMNGWQGPVDVVDFATGKTLETAPAVRGEMAFNGDATRLAAQSGKDLEIVDIASGKVRTVPNARLLGWADVEHVYCLTSAGSLARIGATDAIPDFAGVVDDWAIPSAAGPRLEVDATGKPLRIAAADAKTTLLDLASVDLLVVPSRATFDAQAQSMYSSLQPRWWSPDGRTLALESADATSLALISVDPSRSGAVGSALPTPIGSAYALTQRNGTDLPQAVSRLVSDYKRDALWFLGGDTGKAIDLYRFDVATAGLSVVALDETVANEANPRDSLAIAPDGRLWIGCADQLIVYDPDRSTQTRSSLANSGPDIQADPTIGQPDPWIAGIAFDSQGVALVARNWVRSLTRIDASLKIVGSVEVSDGFAMTGGVAVAGGRVYVLADPASGFGFGVDATGTGKLSNTKFEASAMAGVGGRLVVAGSPPGWMDDQGGVAMTEPVMAAADLVASGPGGVAALYNNPTGELQLRDKDGQVSFHGVFRAVNAAKLATLAFDAEGRVWGVEIVEAATPSYSLVRLATA